MVISDRFSAFDCIWQCEYGLNGVPGKGIALNSVASHWFKLFDKAGLAGNHIVDIPHPYVWIVRKASTVKVEAIARQYITGSMWRDYAKGTRDFCGIDLPEGLAANQKLDEVLITPSTKGIITGVADIPEVDDVNITRENITNNLSVFNGPNEISMMKKHFKTMAKILPAKITFIMLRLLANGWPTKVRTRHWHNSIFEFKCALCGQENSDNIQHYLTSFTIF